MKKQICLISVFSIFLLFFMNSASAWYGTYDYRSVIVFNQTSTETLTNFLANFTIDTATLISADKLDSIGKCLVFTDDNDNELYWHWENYTDGVYGINTAHTQVWIQINFTPNSTVYMYYEDGSCSFGNNTGILDTRWVGIWHTDTLDSSGNGHSSNSNTATLNYSSCQFGSCFHFNSQTISVPDDPALDVNLGDTFTLSFWMTPDILGDTNRYLVAKCDGSPCAYMIRNSVIAWVEGNRTLHPAINTGSTTEWDGLIAVGYTTPTLVTLRYNGTHGTLFINGTEDKSSAKTGNITNNPNVLTFGSNNAGGQPMKGNIDDIKLDNSSQSNNWILREFRQDMNRLLPEEEMPVSSTTTTTESSTTTTTESSTTTTIEESTTTTIWPEECSEGCSQIPIYPYGFESCDLCIGNVTEITNNCTAVCDPEDICSPNLYCLELEQLFYCGCCCETPLGTTTTIEETTTTRITTTSTIPIIYGNNTNPFGCCPISEIFCINNETLEQIWNISYWDNGTFFNVSTAFVNCPYGCDMALNECRSAPIQEYGNYFLYLVAIVIIMGVVIALWRRG